MLEASVEELADEIFRDFILRPSFAARPSIPGLRRRHTPIQRALPIGLGIAYTERPDDFMLAVRVQDEPLSKHKDVLGQISARARGEVNIEVVRDASLYHEHTHHNARAIRSGPVLLGSSISTSDSNALTGTIGLFPFSKKNDKQVILSCAHVFESTGISNSREIIQPGTADGGTIDNAIGTLLSLYPVNLDNQENVIDAAIADPYAGIGDLINTVINPASNKVFTISGVIPPPNHGQVVHKLGRTTGFTSGRIRSKRIRFIEIDYQGNTALFTGFSEIVCNDWLKPFSAKGDSGAVVFDDDGAAFGMVFAGGRHFNPGWNIYPDITYAAPLTNIFDLLELRL